MLFTLKKKISVTNTYFCPDGKIKVFFVIDIFGHEFMKFTYFLIR